jgi:Abortive infection alpha/Protein of unknown function (DUF2806)
MSDEDGPALVIKTGIEQLFAPYHDLLDKLLGPAATEVGGGLADSVKVWRFKRQLRLLQEVQRMLDDSRSDIKPVATRLFFPVLDAASIEDYDELQTRWAALLANESLEPGSVHPSFIEILKQLSPEDARLLDRIHDWCESRKTRRIEWANQTIGQARREEAALQNLIRMGLVRSDYELFQDNKHLKIVGGQPQVFWTPKLEEDYELNDLDVSFVQACRAPKAKSAA